MLNLCFDRAVEKHSCGEAYIVRYPGDFVCCFQYKVGADKFYSNLLVRLNEFNLETESKTIINEFARFTESTRIHSGLRRPEMFNCVGLHSIVVRV